MCQAYVCVNIEPKMVNECCRRLMDMPGVKSAYKTTGRYDCMMMCETKDMKEMMEMVTQKICTCEGVTRTETMYMFPCA